jgi:predicted MPP superfamily phosphohydrolase
MNRRNFLKLSAFSVVAGLIGSYTLFVEHYLVQLNQYRIPVPNLPPEFNGFRIVHLTDLHYGSLVPFSFLQNVIRKANDLKKDVIVCTGDYVQEDDNDEEIDAVWPLLAELKAPLGVYSVLGNHDHWADSHRSAYWLERSGQDIGNRPHAIERGGKRLWIAGGGDLWEDHRDFDDLLRNVPVEDCRIVLAHNPDSADTSFSERIDLMICGHTHGGQVNLPFIGALVLPVENKNYSYGLKTSRKGMPVFISKGIGWAILPVRFNCLPEIAVLELCHLT